MAAKKKADRLINYIRFMINECDLKSRVSCVRSQTPRNANNSHAPVITGT